MVWQSKSALTAACVEFASQAAATVVKLGVANLRNTNRTVHAAACTEQEFLPRVCTWSGGAPALTGAVTVTGVSPGTYAVEVVHDENDKRTLEGPSFLPTEGMGSSRDARMLFRPPKSEDVQFELTQGCATVPPTTPPTTRYLR